MRPRSLTVLDITEYYGETSGGVRTYLREKSAFISRHDSLRQVVVVPGERDRLRETGPVRQYEIGVPFIPGQKPYRAMLAPGRVREILELPTRFQAEEWLGSRGVNWNYSIEDLEADRKTLAALFKVEL